MGNGIAVCQIIILRKMSQTSPKKTGVADSARPDVTRVEGRRRTDSRNSFKLAAGKPEHAGRSPITPRQTRRGVMLSDLTGA